MLVGEKGCVCAQTSHAKSSHAELASELADIKHALRIRYQLAHTSTHRQLTATTICFPHVPDKTPLLAKQECRERAKS
jgi:hypothetical protein